MRLAPPSLPTFIERQLPFDRGAWKITSGEDAGRILHFIDHGPRDGRVVLMIHGNPSWSFLWRKVITELPDHRCVAPDLLGLGFSDHLPRISDHTLARHADAITDFVTGLDLRDFTLAGQDWGGPISTSVGSRLPDRVTAVVLGNTSVLVPKNPLRSPFHRFARFPVISDLAFRGLGIPQIGMRFAQGDRSSIRGDVAKAYRWPLRGWKRRVAPLAMARMVPDSPDHPTFVELKRGEEWIRSFDGPLSIVWGTNDPVLGKLVNRHERELSPARVTRTGAGHFLQEEVPTELATAIRAER